jgi:hypothetical protein
VPRFAAVLAALLLAACSRNVNIQNKEAVREAVISYLTARSAQTGLDMNTMQVDVTALTFRSDEAEATVAFRPKSLPESAAMRLNYTLDRSGNKWVVRGGGTPAPGSEPEPEPELPPNHPPVDGPGGGKSAPGGELPAGHPPVPGTKQ